MGCLDVVELSFCLGGAKVSDFKSIDEEYYYNSKGAEEKM